MDTEKLFQRKKQEALTKLATAKQQHKVDREIIPLLDHINKNPHYFTTSSCAGRIALIQLPDIGDKEHAKFLNKWHHPITPQLLQKHLEKKSQGQLWLLTQPPIFHIAAQTLTYAEHLLKIGINSGFKNSALKTLTPPLLVEILSTERIDSLLGHNDTIYCTSNYLNQLIDIANHILKKSQHKLQQLQINIYNQL